MEGSSETPSVQQQTGKCQLHTMKPHQNLIINLDPCKYEIHLLMIIECLKYSLLITTLTKMESVPMSLLSKSYSSTCYIKEEQRITFDILNHKAVSERVTGSNCANK